MIYNPLTGWLEGFSILIIIFFMVTILSLLDWMKDKKFIELQDKIQDEFLPVYRGKAGYIRTI